MSISFKLYFLKKDLYFCFVLRLFFQQTNKFKWYTVYKFEKPFDDIKLSDFTNILEE